MTFESAEFNHKAILLDGTKAQQGNDIRLKGGITTDYPESGSKVAPEGMMVVKKTSDGLYYPADDTANSVDRNAGAAVTSAEDPDGDWADKLLTWTIYHKDGTVTTGTVQAAGGDETSAAAWVTALEADTLFDGNLTAVDSSGALVITTREKGKVRLRVQLDLSTAYGTVSGSDSYTDAVGTEADYRVITKQRDLVGLGGASRDSDPTPNLLAGRFDLSELANTHPEGIAVMQGRDSSFE